MLRKFAKIESPSPEERKHVSEEEMYIDQPVADNIKNNKILYKRSMKKMSNYNNIYEEMVKEAYENIVDDFSKEAGAQAEAYKKNHARDFAIAENGIRGVYDQATLAQGRKEINKYLSSKEKANKTSALANTLHNLSNPIATGAMLRGLSNKQKVALGLTGAAALAGTGAGIGALVSAKKKKSDEDAAEKAAAYYEEAILAKEAAENDYAVACAYEEAALAILDELGYID